MAERRINIDLSRQEEIRPGLREIGGRLRKLSFTDMMELTHILSENGIRFRDMDGADLAQALLKAAEDMEKA